MDIVHNYRVTKIREILVIHREIMRRNGCEIRLGSSADRACTRSRLADAEAETINIAPVGRYADHRRPDASPPATACRDSATNRTFTQKRLTRSWIGIRWTCVVRAVFGPSMGATRCHLRTQLRPRERSPWNVESSRARMQWHARTVF